MKVTFEFVNDDLPFSKQFFFHFIVVEQHDVFIPSIPLLLQWEKCTDSNSIYT